MSIWGVHFTDFAPCPRRSADSLNRGHAAAASACQFGANGMCIILLGRFRSQSSPRPRM
jgi:hypothetical protein